MKESIDKIINSNLITFPWEHKVIDDLVSPEVLGRLSKAAELLSPHGVYRDFKGIWLRGAEELGVDKQTIDDCINLADGLLNNIQELSDPFKKFNASNSGYFCMPKFAVTGKDYRFPIHTDGFNKVLVIVLYLYPENNIGTKFYKTEQADSYTHTLEWKPNRAFMLCPYMGKDTWHDWSNETEPNRVTLKFEIEKIENIERNINSECSMFDNTDDLLWLYDQFGKGHLTSTI